MMSSCALTAILMVAAIIDLRTQHIPPLIPVLVVLLAPLNPQWEICAAFMGMAVCGGSLLAATLIQPGAFGGGDIKLLAALGYLLGLAQGTLGLFFAIVLSLPVAVFYHFKKSTIYIPFAPFIAIGYIAALLLYQGGIL